MMTNNYLYNLNGNLNRLSKYLEQESTGKAINSISDDPVKATQSLSARNKLSGISRYQENVGAAQDWLTEVEESVSQMNYVIQDAYEKAVSASTDTLNATDLAAISEEIAALRDEVLSTANATFGDSYLFAGYNMKGTSSGDLPYEVDPNGDVYFNGINMSNEAAVDSVAAASFIAAEALDTATVADTTVQGLSTSNYNEIVEAVSMVIDSGEEIAAAAQTTMDAAADITNSADIDTATATELAVASGVVQTYSDVLSDSITTAENAVFVARSAAASAKQASETLAEATASGDSGSIAEAQDAYDEAVLAAEDAAAEAQTASSALLTAAADVKNAVDDGDAVTTTDVRTIIENSPALADASAALDLKSEDVLAVQVGSGQTMQVSVSGTELLGRGDENVYVILDEFYNALKNDADASELNNYVSRLQDAQSRILSLDAAVGAKLQRLNTLSARYEVNFLNYTAMKSDAEDADLAEVITNFTTAETVYNAALSSGAEIIQTTLLDFLR